MRDAALQNVTLSLGAISADGQVLQSDKMSMDRACMCYAARHFLSISAFWKFLGSISNIIGFIVSSELLTHFIDSLNPNCTNDLTVSTDTT